METNPKYTNGRLVKGGTITVEPLYAASRLLKQGVLEAEEKISLAEAELSDLREVIERERHAFDAEIAARRSELESEAEQIRNDAYEHASQDGTEEFLRLLEEARPKVEQLQDHYVHRLRDLVFRIAREVLGVELETRPEVIVDLVRSALSAAVARTRVTVLLNPEVLPFVRRRRQELMMQLPLLEELHFREDPMMPRTGVRLETEMGSYDGGLDAQLGELLRKWQGE